MLYVALTLCRTEKVLEEMQISVRPPPQLQLGTASIASSNPNRQSGHLRRGDIIEEVSDGDSVDSSYEDNSVIEEETSDEGEEEKDQEEKDQEKNEGKGKKGDKGESDDEGDDEGKKGRGKEKRSEESAVSF